jgi:ABC-type nitrate/sulfonate/bicarbonate transport system substrate-binding protein
MLPYLTYAPLVLAQEAGDFQARGLDVEFVSMRSSTGAVPLLLGGDLDVLPAYLGPGFFNAIARGEAIRLVADAGRLPSSGCTLLALVVRGDVLEDRRPVSSRRALSLSAPAGMTSELFAERALEQAGVSLDRVRTVAMPNEAELAALEKGSLDLAVLGSPWLPLPPTSKDVQILARERDVLPGFQSAVLAFGPRLVEREPQVGGRFMMAYLDGVRRYNRGKTAENLAILSRATGLEPGLLNRTCWPPIREDGQIDLQSVRRYQEWAARKGYLDQVLPEGRWWDPRFIDQAGRASTFAGAEENGP